MISNTENPNLLQDKTKSDSYDILSAALFAPGDVVFLDIDDTLLFCKGDEKYTATPLITHPKLRALLDTLQNQGVICIGLTARDPMLSNVTKEQLSELGISFNLAQNLLAHSVFQGKGFAYQDGVFYSPSLKQNDQKISTKGDTAVTILHALKAVDVKRLEENGLSQKRFAKHIFALDDLPMNLISIKQSLESAKETLDFDSIESLLVQKKAAFCFK